VRNARFNVATQDNDMVKAKEGKKPTRDASKQGKNQHNDEAVPVVPLLQPLPSALLPLHERHQHLVCIHQSWC
jgi:hypothetical protein